MNGLRGGLSDFDLLTIAEVGALLHCSKAHISNIIAGRVAGCLPIPAVHLGRRTLVRRAALAAWVECNENAAANDNHGGAANDNLRASPERGRKSA
jgi:ParB-like chromosome segregation protein Spo0J